MLARIRKAMEEKEEGFTLIELLVVMIIIGILAAIAIPVFLSQRQKGYDASLKSDLRTIANDLESYNVDNQAYPTNTAGAALTPVSGTLTSPTGTILHLSSGNVFWWIVNTAGSGYCIVGDNPKGAHQWEYISTQGGLQPVATVATAVGATALASCTYPLGTPGSTTF